MMPLSDQHSRLPSWKTCSGRDRQQPTHCGHCVEYCLRLTQADRELRLVPLLASSYTELFDSLRSNKTFLVSLRVLRRPRRVVKTQSKELADARPGLKVDLLMYSGEALTEKLQAPKSSEGCAPMEHQFVFSFDFDKCQSAWTIHC